MSGTDLTRWADRAMYPSEPMTAKGPTVTLLNATPDPLGSVAALAGMYRGEIAHSLRGVDDSARRLAFRDMTKTELNGALEAVQFHFLIEGVTRAWTHQAVRTRAAFFAQESLRFAVVDNEPWLERCAYPPSLAAETVTTEELMRRDGADRLFPKLMTDEERAYALKRDAWNDAILTSEAAYKSLIEAGVPAEDARGLMPHAMTTRLMMVCSLRTLLHQAGLRLCTQAQFEWRQVMAGIVLAVRNYRVRPGWKEQHTSYWWHECGVQYATKAQMDGHLERCDSWQFQLIADALKPVCYQTGRCGFMASMDRGCSIRGRVDAFARAGVEPKDWDNDYWTCGYHGESCTDEACPGQTVRLEGINPAEWALDPTAARHGGGGFVGKEEG